MLTQRRLLPIAVGLAFALLMLVLVPFIGSGDAYLALAQTRSHPVKHPNILFILIDDMGFSDLSITGNRNAGHATGHFGKWHLGGE